MLRLARRGKSWSPSASWRGSDPEGQSLEGGWMDVEERLTLTEASNLIAERDTRTSDTTKTVAYERTKKLIMRHVGKGKLKRGEDGKFRVGDLVSWARLNIRTGDFSDLPTDPVNAIGRAVGRPGVASGFGITVPLLPDDPIEAKKVYSLLIRRCAEAEFKLYQLRRANEKLKPDAERYRAWCEKNRLNPTKNRK